MAVPGDSTLRVANVADDAGLEAVRDTLDTLGVDYEFVRSEPEDEYPQTAYFAVPEASAEEIEDVLAGLAEEHGFEAEVI